MTWDELKEKIEKMTPLQRKQEIVAKCANHTEQYPYVDLTYYQEENGTPYLVVD